MKSKGVVYCVTNTRNGKKYVGISLRGAKERWAQHVRDARNGSKLPLHRAIRKHGPDAFTVRVLARSDDWDQLCRWEVETIARLKTHVRHGGYNATAGGDGVVDLPEESRAKIGAATRETNKHRWQDEEFRAKMSAKTKRQNADPEFRAKQLIAVKRLNADPEFAARRDAASSERMKRQNADPEFAARRDAKWQDPEFRAKMKTTIQRLLAEGWQPGERTAFNDFCRAHELKGLNVRNRLRKRGLYGLKDINHPIVREVLEEMIAERRADTVVPARRAQSPKTLRPMLH